MPDLIRVVIDTNHIMSAMLSATGASAKLIEWMTRDEDYFQLVLSPPIWEEYTTVAAWLVPPARAEERERVLQILRQRPEFALVDQALAEMEAGNKGRALVLHDACRSWIYNRCDRIPDKRHRRPEKGEERR